MRFFWTVYKLSRKDGCSIKESLRFAWRFERVIPAPLVPRPGTVDAWRFHDERGQ